MKSNKTIAICSMIIVLVPGMTLCTADEPKWPREIDIPEAKIVMYQPQLESFEDNRLKARAAVSVTRSDETEPVFGAVWLDATVSTDRDTRTVTCTNVRVPEARFPDADPAKVEKLKRILEREIPKWDLNISLDRLLTMMDLVEKKKRAAEELKTTPPKIVIAYNPAVLITIQGQPQLQKIERSGFMRVVNTPFFIAYDPKGKTYYLKGGDEWLAASEIVGPWQSSSRVPPAVVSAAESPDTTQQQIQQPDLDTMPQIIVATEPTELVVLQGQPSYSTIYGVDILYVANTKSDLFMEIDTQNYYLLLSGRWYSCDSLEGEWTYVPGKELPAGFSKIPPGSVKAGVLSSVPQTQQAKDAVLESQIPQTAQVNRSQAQLAVTYDGDPEFVEIEDTDMLYAANTSYSVIRYRNRYYCCNDGVWFLAESPNGPWHVCVDVPQVIYTIPPSCPIYNVRYVYVYGHTPDVVYVGYTPGYLGSYVYGGTVVYGTGYVYPAWYGSYYYPRPVTYGYGAAYTPYSGWAFAAGLAVGWVASNAYYGGWWGARGFRDIDINYNRNININNSRHNIYNRRKDLAQRPGHRPGGRPGSGRPGGGRPGGDRPGDRPVAGRPGTGRPGVERPVAGRPGAERPGRDRPGAERPSTRPSRPNNVYADRDGNVYRRDQSGWQKRDNGKWSQHRPSQPTDRSRPSGQRRPSNLDRQSAARNRGSARTRDYERNRSYGRGGSRSGGSRTGGSRSGGGSRGGGGRRGGGGGRGRR